MRLDRTCTQDRSSSQADGVVKSLDAVPAGSGTGAALPGALAMIFVGGSVAVSGLLADAALATTQAVRYAVACLLLVVLARLTGRRLVRPRGAEWPWLLGVAVAGLVLFNVALVRGAAHAEPAVLGVAVACVPVVLALVGPALEGRRPSPVLLAAGAVVTCGAVLVQGLGRADAVGLGWALVVLACEAAFTLLAVPVLGRHGPWGVSVHATWLAAVVFAAPGVGVVAVAGLADDLDLLVAAEDLGDVASVVRGVVDDEHAQGGLEHPGLTLYLLGSFARFYTDGVGFWNGGFPDAPGPGPAPAPAPASDAPSRTAAAGLR